MKQNHKELFDSLKRLHEWALVQQGGCTFSGDHPIAAAAVVLSRAKNQADMLVNEIVEQGQLFKCGEIKESDFIRAVNHYVDQALKSEE